MERSSVTTKGQILIPKRLREKYGIKPGAKVELIEAKNGLVIKAIDENYFDQFIGKYKDCLPTKVEWLAWKKEDLNLEEAKINKLT